MALQEDESADLADKLIALKTEEKTREKEIKALTHEIAQLREELAKPPPSNLSTEADLQIAKVSIYTAIFVPF